MKCGKCGSEWTQAAQFCPSCGASLQIVESAVLEAERTRASLRKVAIILFPVVLIAGAFFFIKFINPSVNSVIKAQPVVSAPSTYDSNEVRMQNIQFKDDGSELVFSLRELLKNRLVRFEYTGGKTPRPIMAYIAPTGQLVTAISLSEHCGSTEFKIKNNKIYCARCPSYWDMMTMEAYACCAKYHPDPIPSRVEGDEVRVSKILIEKWAGRL